MLFLLFTLGEARYGLDTGEIIEIVPMLNLTKLPHAPDIIAGCLRVCGGRGRRKSTKSGNSG